MEETIPKCWTYLKNMDNLSILSITGLFTARHGNIVACTCQTHIICPSLATPLPNMVIYSSLHLHPNFTYPVTARALGAPQMISQPVSSIFPCSPLPSGIWRTPGLSIPLRCLPTSSSVCLVFFPLSLCIARGFWPDLMNGRHGNSTAVCEGRSR